MLSLPNILTLSRILTVPLLLLLLWPGSGDSSLAEAGKLATIQPKPLDYAFAFVLYCLMGVTDYFDGYIARTRGAVSRLGTFLDPIADKIMIAAIILLLVYTRDIDGWHVIAALVILLREIIVSGLREFLATINVSMPVTHLAKWKTAFQIIAFGALILAGALPSLAFIKLTGVICLWSAAGLTIITGWSYLRTGLRHMD